MNRSINNLNQALAFQLEGVYEIVKQLQSDVLKATRSVGDPEIRMAFTAYRQNLDDQRLKLKRIFGYLLNGPYGRKAPRAAHAVVQWDEIIEKDMIPRLRDILLSSSLQMTIRCLVTAYTDARYIAMRLELDTVVQLLDEIVDVEEEFHQKVRRLSAMQINEACLLATN